MTEAVVAQAAIRIDAGPCPVWPRRHIIPRSAKKEELRLRTAKYANHAGKDSRDIRRSIGPIPQLHTFTAQPQGPGEKLRAGIFQGGLVYWRVRRLTPLPGEGHLGNVSTVDLNK